MAGKLGLVTIGQSPRSDYETIYKHHAPDSEILWAGALDGFTQSEARELEAKGDSYPLHTGLADGTKLAISLEVLLPLVEERAGELAEDGADLIILLCAGGFPEFECPAPVLLPGNVMPNVARTLTKRGRVGVVTPIAGQIEPARKKWTEDGFEVEVVAGSPDNDEETRQAAKELATHDLELIVLDCMGHHSGHQREVAEISGLPVIVAQNVVARIAGEYMSGVPKQVRTGV